MKKRISSRETGVTSTPWAKCHECHGSLPKDINQIWHVAVSYGTKNFCSEECADKFKEELKLADYWDHSISGQLKSKVPKNNPYSVDDTSNV